jgi:putative iron-only hydrogenase system regulator
METRVALLAIIVEKPENTEKMNALLHQYSDYIFGRMGVPYRRRGINVISIAVDAPSDVISELAGKLGRLEGLSVKAAYSRHTFRDQDTDEDRQ